MSAVPAATPGPTGVSCLALVFSVMDDVLLGFRSFSSVHKPMAATGFLKGRKIPGYIGFEPVPASIMWQNGAKKIRREPGELSDNPLWFPLSLHASSLVLRRVNIDLQPWSKVSDLMQFTASIKARDVRERAPALTHTHMHRDAQIILIPADVTVNAASQGRERNAAG